MSEYTQIYAIERKLAFLTSTPLAGAGVYTSPTIDGINYKIMSQSFFADQAGGYVVQFSDDGITWDSVTSVAVAASTLVLPNTTISKRYTRTVYTNGATPQGTFRTSAYLSPL